MEISKGKSIIAAFLMLALIVISSVIYASTGNHNIGIPQIIATDALFFLVFSVTAMISTLRISLKDDFYSYRNIELIGAIIFFLILITDLTAYFVSSFTKEDMSQEYIFSLILEFPKTFSYYTLFFILAVSIIIGISNISLMIHEKACLHNALSLLVSGFYTVCTVLVYVVSDLLKKYVFIPHGYYTDNLFLVLHTMIPMFLLLLLSCFECIAIGTGIMGYLAAKKIPSYDKDYIIILGCSIDKRGGLLPLLKGRVNRAVKFAWEQELSSGKPLKYVPSGGQGPNEIISEGSAMEMYLLSHGAEPFEVIPEKKSRSTWENLCFSKKIIDEINPDAKIAYATTNYHILRSGILAKKAGLNAEGIASKTKWYFWPNGFLREFFAILVMNIKAHINMAIILAAVCTAIGCIGYFGGFI